MDSYQSTQDTGSQKQSSQQPGGKAPIAEKVIVIHPEKKPTIVFNDWQKSRDIFNSMDMGPSFECSEPDTDCKVRPTKMHSFIETVGLSYVHHLPLLLSPDDVWIAIMQGLSIHIEQNAESLRKKFVDFDGKKVLYVVREEPHWFMLNHGEYAPTFGEFSDQIKDNIGEKNHQTLVPKFSTTGPL